MVCTPIQPLTHPMTEYLDLVKPFVSDQLIDANSWSNIEAIAQHLPSQLSNFFGFECRLGNPAAQADFLLCVEAKEAGQNLLAAHETAMGLSDRLFQGPVWPQIRHFTAEWQNQDAALHSKVNNIWLEFDVDASSTESTELPVPSCFFGSQSIAADPTGTGVNRWVSQEAIALLRGQPLPSAVEQHLFRCFDALPGDAHVFQIGLMLARQSDYVRICVRGISPAQILDYLYQVGWSGSGSALQDLLNQLSTYAGRIDLDLDVGAEGVATKIGLECYFAQQPKHEPKWQAFFEFLVHAGLCLPQKQVALLTYPGIVREKAYRDQWPSHLAKLSQFLGDNYESVIVRGLHHVKVVYQSEQSIEAKAYCWVAHHLVSKPAFYQIHQFNRASVQLDQFLTPDEQQQLLAYVIENESGFVPSEILQDQGSGRSNRFHRNSLVYDPPFPEFSNLIRDRIRQKLPEIMTRLNLDPFPIADLEAQLTAHNDGHYYKLHNDNGVPQTAARRLTFVYYFYREPKSFTGGELRIFNTPVDPASGQNQTFKLIEPRNNSIVIFPSQYMHEVLPVLCPSQAFADSRFTINGWVWHTDDSRSTTELDP